VLLSRSGSGSEKLLQPKWVKIVPVSSQSSFEFHRKKNLLPKSCLRIFLWLQSRILKRPKCWLPKELKVPGKITFVYFFNSRQFMSHTVYQYIYFLTQSKIHFDNMQVYLENIQCIAAINSTFIPNVNSWTVLKYTVIQIVNTGCVKNWSWYGRKLVRTIQQTNMLTVSGSGSCPEKNKIFSCSADKKNTTNGSRN